MIRTTLFAALLAASLAAHAQTNQADTTRYVWAAKLSLYAKPDLKSARVARLPYGSKVTLLGKYGVARHEVLANLAVKDNLPAAQVKFDGHWHRVHATAGNGWLFDAYLSRYPAPPKAKPGAEEDQDGSIFAKSAFGVKEAYKWDVGDSKTTPDYRVMLSHTSLRERDVDPVLSWEYVVFQDGATYERFAHRPDGGVYLRNVDFKNLQLTYGEALLWLKQFHSFESMDGKNVDGVGKLGGKVDPGRHLELEPGPDDNTGLGYVSTLDCTPATCDISRHYENQNK